jgi:hypothetical protein
MATNDQLDKPNQIDEAIDLTIDPPAVDENGDTWLTDEGALDNFNWRWRKVIEQLMNGARIYEAYATAYEIDTEIPGQYNVAKVNGSRLLTNANFRRLWDKVLAENGFTSQHVDLQLMNIIMSPKTEPGTRLVAIRTFNELNGRIVKKVDHTSKGQPLPLLGGSTPMVDEDDDADEPAGHDSASENPAAP